MNLKEEGIRRSLLAIDVAKLQAEDAAEAAKKRSRMIDWAPVDGDEMFYGPLPETVDDHLPMVEMKKVGKAERAAQRFHRLFHWLHWRKKHA